MKNPYTPKINQIRTIIQENDKQNQPFSICKANSRVGAKTKTFGPFRSDLGINWYSVWIIAGSKKANVLPDFVQ